MTNYSDIDTLSKQVEDLMREKQHVISIVSHDLRSPLNRIFALTQLLQLDGSNLTSEQKDYLEKIHLVIADGLAMMRNLVDYNNLEHSTINLLVETFNVGDFIESVAKHFKPLAAKKKIELKVACGNTLTITTDKLCLSRVLDNLLANAVKFSPEGKKISVLAGMFDDALKIEVHDEARGFLSDELPKLFHKFQRHSARPTAGESSTGIGLFIAQSMAEKIGGKIMCTTTEGIGSVFSVELPKTIDQSNK